MGLVQSGAVSRARWVLRLLPISNPKKEPDYVGLPRYLIFSIGMTLKEHTDGHPAANHTAIVTMASPVVALGAQCVVGSADFAVVLAIGLGQPLAVRTF